MSMEKKVTDLIKDAMKSGDKPRLMALRAVKSALTNERTRHSGELSDEDSLKVVSSYRKKMDGARVQYEDANREELAAQAKLEVEVCDSLLPERVTGDKLLEMVKAKVEETGAKEPKDMGRVMGPLMKELGSQADGNEVKQMVMKLLGN